MLGEEDIRHLLLLIPTNPRGMVSRQEFMRFMEQEFEGLDLEKKDKLEVAKLAPANQPACGEISRSHPNKIRYLPPTLGLLAARQRGHPNATEAK